MYQLENIEHRYGARLVLKLETLSVRRGEVLALVGPSGAGKSTLLRLLNFLETPTAGRIIFDGTPLAAEAPLNLARRVTTVFQRPILLNRSVQANIAFGLQLRDQRDDARVEAVLKQVGLQELAHAPARKLSGGEQQRAALARALVLQPDVLLLDEPTANLDPYNVNLIEQIVRAQNQAHRTTVVLVTHNLFQAKRLASQVGLLLNGQLVELASTEKFFENPQDARTAAFVRGEMVW
jgi:tungstate transport system ATP-binding protein